MERRKFITGAALAGTGAVLAAPAIAQGVKTITVVSTWPRDFPGLGISVSWSWYATVLKIRDDDDDTD